MRLVVHFFTSKPELRTSENDKATDMNLTQLLTDFNHKSGEHENNENLFVAAAFAHILQRYVVTATPSYVLTLCCRNGHSCNFFYDILEKLFRVWVTASIQFVVIPENSTLHVPGRRHYNILLVDSFQAFSEIDVISYTKHYNYNEFYYIFLRTRDDLLAAEMQRILEYCWAHQLINCNVQVQLSSGAVLIYTYFPFTAEHCGKVVPVLINQFNGTSLLVDELFPRKLRNFYGCPLRAALWDVPPYVYLRTDEHGGGRVVGGIEGNLLLELATRLNFAIEVITPPNNKQRGFFKANEWSGAMGMLYKRIVHLSLGCFRQTTKRDANATAIPNYYQSAAVAVVAKSEFHFTSLQILFYPFKTSTWLLIAAVCALILSVSVAANRYRKQHPQLFTKNDTSSAVLNLVLVLTGMPTRTTPAQHHERIFYTSWMLFTLVLRVIYQALLFHFIRTGVTNPIPETFNDLVKQNYTLAMTYTTRAGFISEIAALQQLGHIELNSTDETVVFDYMANNGQKGVVGVGPKDFLQHYVRTNNKTGVLKAMPQDMVNLQMTMYLTKHSFLVNEFEEEIMWLRPSGLMVLWSRWELDDDYFKTVVRDDVEIFDLSKLQATFIVFLGGLFMACVVFSLELMSKRIQFLRAVFMKM